MNWMSSSRSVRYTAADQQADQRVVVPAGERQRPCFAQRQRVEEEHAKVAVAGSDVGLRNEIAAADRVAVRRKVRRLGLLRETRLAGVATQAGDELVPVASEIALQRQLKPEAPALLVDRRPIVGGFVGLQHSLLGVRLAVVAVDVTAYVCIAIAPVIEVAAEQRGVV